MDADDVAGEAGAAWGVDNVILTTVGVDIGSSTSHLTFSRIWLQRESQYLSSRFVVVEREALYRSPIILTPYTTDELIDVTRLAAFIEGSYAAAGFKPSDIDSGAVILTGVALDRANSRAIGELFSREGGKFVCASAGHVLEAILAAHGSGAVDLSIREHTTVLNVDLGGGTTKLALIVDGHIEATMAIGVGARLISFSDQGRIERIEPHGRLIAHLAGLDVQVGDSLEATERRQIAGFLANLVVAAIQGRWESVGPIELLLAGHLPTTSPINAITFSGGVSEFIYDRADREFGDLAREFADAMKTHWRELPATIVTPREGIRATVMGASQYTVQLSGNTVYLSKQAALPLRNVPVVRLLGDLPDDLDSAALKETVLRESVVLGLDGLAGPLAISVPWTLTPRYQVIRYLAEGLLAFHVARAQPESPLIIALDGDIAATLGHLLAEDLGYGGELIALDGLALEPLDYLDIGEMLAPANVVPVVIKSLVFPKASG